MASKFPLTLIPGATDKIQEIISGDTIDPASLPTITVDKGGTGRIAHVAYTPLCGGTTTAGAQQSVASTGTANQRLLSAGAGALPTFGNVPEAVVVVGSPASTTPNARQLALGANLRATDAGAGSTYTLNAALAPSRIVREDHFLAPFANTANGLMGESGLVLINTQVSGTSVFGFSQATSLTGAGNPGVVFLRVTNAAGASGIASLRSGPMLVSAFDRMTFLVKGAVGTADGAIRVGLSNNVATAGEAAHGVYWSVHTATTAGFWRTVTRDGSGVEQQVTTIAFDQTNWKQLEIRRNGSSFEFWANTGTTAPALVSTHSTIFPTTTAVYLTFSVESTSAGASDFGASIDYMGLESIALTSQYS